MGESGVAVSTNIIHDGSGDVGAVSNQEGDYANVPVLWEKGNVDVTVSENIAYGQVKLGHEAASFSFGEGDYEIVM